MHVPSIYITLILISCSVINRVFVCASTFDYPASTEFSTSAKMPTILTDTDDSTTTTNKSDQNSVAKEETSWDTTLVSTICKFVPDFCNKIRHIKEHFFLDRGDFEARGPKDLIAIISTILAALLGAILVKLNVLIVLSLISVGIGKLLLLILALKTKIFSTDHSHEHHQPFVYEKVYYPQQRHHHILDQRGYPSEAYQESSYTYS